jgi:ribosomal-protein-alanine N-acetyltransferase
MAILLTTPRLTIRDWAPDDAAAAFAVYGEERLAPWLLPALSPIPDVTAMRCVLESEQPWPDAIPPSGHWALALRGEGLVVGGVSLRLLPPYEEDLEICWQLARSHWRHGYAAEAGRALARWAFTHGADEVFAVVWPGNDRSAATARRIGMEWVGETDKYYQRLLQVYRLRPGDLNVSVIHEGSAAR